MPFRMSRYLNRELCCKHAMGINFAILTHMCGCYTITVDKSTLEYHFNAKFASGQEEFEPNYNTVPS